MADPSKIATGAGRKKRAQVRGVLKEIRSAVEAGGAVTELCRPQLSVDHAVLHGVLVGEGEQGSENAANTNQR